MRVRKERIRAGGYRFAGWMDGVAIIVSARCVTYKAIKPIPRSVSGRSSISSRSVSSQLLCYSALTLHTP